MLIGRFSPILAAALLVWLAPEPVRAANAEVERLYQDEIRYHAGRGDNFSALVALLNAESNGYMDLRDLSALELLGRLQLGFGLYADARGTLDAVLDSNAGEDLRQTVWVDVARDALQRGELATARAALDRIGPRVTPQYAGQVARLRARVEQLGGHDARAAAILESIGTDRRDLLVRFNLALAYLNQGRSESAATVLRELVATRPLEESSRALRDMANFRLGLLLAGQGRREEALQRFEEIRLHGPVGTRALLASGRVLAELNRPDRALVPWKLLRQRTVLDPMVQEAWIRVGLTQFELRQHQDAAYNFEEAVDAFKRALRQIEDARLAIGSGRLVEALRQFDTGSDWTAQLLAGVPESRVLGGVLSGAGFQREFRVHREVNALLANLRRWRANIDVFRSMLREHRELFGKRSQWIGEKLEALDLAPLEARIRQLSANARGQDDSLALATTAERAWLDRLRRLESHLDELPAADRAAFANRIRLLRARLAWQREIEQDERRQRIEGGLGQASEALDEARAGLGRILAGRDNALALIERRLRLLDAMQKRVDGLLPDAEAVLQEQEALLVAMLSGELDRLQQRLQRRLVQVRILAARNYDAALAAEPGGASP